MARRAESGLQWEKVVVYGTVAGIVGLNIAAGMGSEVVPTAMLTMLDLLVIAFFMGEGA